MSEPRLDKSLLVGLLVGAVLGAAALTWLPKGGRPDAHPAALPNVAADAQVVAALRDDDWLAQARTLTMADRRSYTLPLNNPSTVMGRDAVHMRPDDPIVGVKVRGQARAYPWWVLTNYHVVNDTLKQYPLYVGLCELCSGAAAFHPVIDEMPRRPLVFQISGMAQGTFEISDVQTASKWHPFAGIAKSGPLAGRKLERVPSVMTRWADWLVLEPETDVVLAGEAQRLRRHAQRHQVVGAPDRMEYGLVEDDRLRSNVLVFGVVGEADGTGIAFPLETLKQRPVHEVDVEGRPILLFADGDFRVQAYHRVVEQQALSFERLDGPVPRLVDQHGSVWNQWGQGVSGKLAGKQLEPVRGYLTEWYEWVSAFPKTEIY